MTLPSPPTILDCIWFLSPLPIIDMVRRRNMFSILYCIAAAAALSIPSHVAHRTLHSRGLLGARHHTINAPAYLETRDGAELQVHVENKLGKELHAYVSGQVQSQHVLLGVKEAESSFIGLPTTGNGTATAGLVAIPNLQPISIPKEGKDFTIPGYMGSARVYISETPALRFRAQVSGGSGRPELEQPDFLNPTDPAQNASWGFMEFEYNEAELFMDITFVDFVGLPIGMSMTYNADSNETTDTIAGPHKDALKSLCDGISNLKDQDPGVPWADLCFKNSANEPLRVMAPEKYMSLHPDSGFNTYYDPYVDEVWKKYTDEALTIDTQDRSGQAVAHGLEIPCKVEQPGDVLTCRFGNGTVAASFKKPTSREIFGCAGTGPGSAFDLPADASDTQKELMTRLCAALNRSTLLLSATPLKVPKQNYYGHKITNHYSRLVHENLADGKGYAFAYDDVNMDPTDPNENSAGVIQKANPVRMEIIVGGDDA